MPKQKIVFFLLFVVCLSRFGFSQITASQVNGCAPATISFTAPPGATAGTWNFGNGTSPYLNASNVFNSPGVYNVTFTSSSGVVSTIQINIIANNVTPALTFNVPQIKCAPLCVSFSGTGGTPGSTFQWTFGDGGQGTGSSTNYCYTLGGIFNATLTVIDAVSGCVGTTSGGPINVSTFPSPVITATPGLSSCTAPFTTAFTGTNSSSGSPLGGALTYSWSFGNSQTSTQPTPGSITYNNQGYYNVTLTVTDNNNCSNSTTEVVSVVQPSVQATVPGTICILHQDPTDTIWSFSVESSQPNTTWNFGNGTLTVPPPPQSLSPGVAFTYTYPLYTTPGLRTITITASNGNCVATQTLNIFVEQITPQFTFIPTYTCSPTIVTTFTNQSTVNDGSALSYSWGVSHWSQPLFGVFYTSNAVNPTFTITEGSLSPYAYYGMSIANTQLTVTSVNGCTAEINHITDTIWRPTARFNKSRQQGCSPLIVSFRDTSNISPKFPMLSYTWYSGTNPPATFPGNVPPPMIQPTFTYSSPGTYTPYLVINTGGGCSATSFVDTIIVVTPLTVSSAYLRDTAVCAGQPVTLHVSALPTPSVVDHWHIASDDNYFSGCINDSIQTWPFTHLGIHGFTISAYNHGCESQLVAPQTITVNGPVAKFRYQTNCTNKKSVDFSVFMDHAQAATLDFGDGNFMTMTGNPSGTASSFTTHVYPASGNYTAVLTASNSVTGCTFTFSNVVTIRQISAGFTMPQTVCKGGGFLMDASSSVDALITCNMGHTWLLDDTIIPIYDPTTPTSYTFFVPGTHTVTLVVKDVNGCRANVTHTIYVDAPAPTFTFVNPACVANMPLQFVNTTTNALASSANYTWTFFGNPDSYTVSCCTPTNNLYWPVHNYNPPPPGASYQVKLKAKSAIGCLDSITQVVPVINPPNAYLYPYKPNTCVNLPELFNTPPNFTNSVNFGDGSPSYTSAAAMGLPTGTVVHTYTAAGSYTPVLTIGFGGCSSTFENVVLVQNYPNASFTYAPTNSLVASSGSIVCAPIDINFTSTSVAADSINYIWNIGLGPTINSVTVTRHIEQAGVYPISLITSTFPSGCTDTVMQTIVALTPTANGAVSNPRFCLGESIRLSLKDTSDVFAWVWYYGNGLNDTILAASAPSPTLIYPYQYFPPPNGAAVVSLVYFSTNFTCRHSTTLSIQAVKVDADFKRNLELTPIDSVHCLNLTDNFTNTSIINNSTMIGGLIFNWDFGNGTTASTQDFQYTYPDPGVYTVSLTIKDPQAGCTDMSVKHMTINPLPTVTVSVPDSVCRNSTFSLNSSGSPDIASYQWLPAQGVVSPNQASTAVTATISGSYSLSVLNVYGCKNIPTALTHHSVYVQQPPPTIHWDTTLIIGQTTILNTNIGAGFNYTWSPLTDLSCSSCPYPTSTTTANITYSVDVTDPMGCFRVVNTYTVIVDPLTTVDVPTAFTPNGDGINDVIYVDGWGIRKLNYFRIFNRWGQLLFESTDLKVGWDGSFRGVPQNMETYIYQVSAEGYIKDAKPYEKTSSFRLIR